MVDTATITLIIGMIGCVIGVCTFVSGRMARAERNGSMETKIEQALEGISAINRKLEASSNDQHNMNLMVRSHEEQIKTLFNANQELRAAIDESNHTRDVLVELLNYIKNKE